MNRLSIALILVFVITGCASKPPMPPEPTGPLVKVNIYQPHDTFGGNE